LRYDASGLGSVLAEGAYQPIGTNGLFALYQGEFDDTLLTYQLIHRSSPSALHRQHGLP
jgi:hypothetical protein